MRKDRLVVDAGYGLVEPCDIIICPTLDPRDSNVTVL
jgi:hypothetical protein